MKIKVNFFREIAFLEVLNFSQFKNWFLVKIKFREIDLFDFTSFLAWNFLNFPAHCA